MMTGCCDDFDTYKQGYQSIRAFSLLMTFSQMRLPMYDLRSEEFPRLRANCARQDQEGCHKAMRGRGYKAAMEAKCRLFIIFNY